MSVLALPAHVAVIPSGLDISLPVVEIQALFKPLGGVLEKVAIFLASPQGQAYVLEGLITLDNLLSIIGLFVPPVAVAANDLKIGITILKAAQPIIIWLEHQPAPDGTGKINVFGSLMEPKGIFQN